MTPEENFVFLTGLMGKVADAAGPIATAMATTFQRRVTTVELKEEFHPPGMFWRQVVGHPPAYASGALARSVRSGKTVSSGTQAVASVGAFARYAAIQEFGGDTWGNRGMMHWVNTGGSWYFRRVHVPEHPYFRPALEAVIRDGSLQRSAVSVFAAHMSPYVR
jgi:phage gpG-like protein